MGVVVAGGPAPEPFTLMRTAGMFGCARLSPSVGCVACSDPIPGSRAGADVVIRSYQKLLLMPEQDFLGADYSGRDTIPDLEPIASQLQVSPSWCTRLCRAMVGVIPQKKAYFHAYDERFLNYGNLIQDLWHV